MSDSWYGGTNCLSTPASACAGIQVITGELNDVDSEYAARGAGNSTHGRGAVSQHASRQTPSKVTAVLCGGTDNTRTVCDGEASHVGCSPGDSNTYTSDNHSHAHGDTASSVHSSCSFLHWNIGGLVQKLNDPDFVQYVASFDFICLVETFV